MTLGLPRGHSFLLVLSNSAFAQKYDSIEVSNSKESDIIGINAVGFRTGNLLRA
jgi:hypothetical protein